MEWSTKYLFRSLNIDKLAGDVRIPEWVDGKEYFIAVVSTDALAQVGTSEETGALGSWAEVAPVQDTGYRFIFDKSTPTMTAFAVIANLSDDINNPSWLNELKIASGTITDNVSHILDPRQVYIRVYDRTNQKYLNTSSFKF